MSSHESQSGREPVVLVEIDQDFCELEYSVSPCEAELGTTGDRKCYNTRFTCQDPTNYTRGTLTLRFAQPHAEIPFSWGHVIPSLAGKPGTTPTEINPGGGDTDRSALGSRATVRVRFQDHPHSDFKVDKYRAERLDGTASASGETFNPLERGTFWTRWLRRTPYYVGRELRIREGYIDQAPSEMTTRHYVIREIDGPDSNGRVTVKGEDILSLVEFGRRQAPLPTEGELLNDISESDDSFTIVNYRDASEYPSDGGTVRINDEVMTYESASENNGEITFTSVVRSTDGTEVSEHDAGDNVQLCLRYENVPVWDVLRELIEDFGKVPSRFVPFSDWEIEGETWLQNMDVRTLITEPEDVEQLVGELSQQCLVYLWWDERDQEIKLAAIRPPTKTPPELNDRQHIIADSVSYKRDVKARISQYWIYFQQRDPTENLDETTNYRRLRVDIDSEAEQDDQYGSKQVKRTYSRWLQRESQAIQLGGRMLDRYRNGRRQIRLRVDAKDRSIWTGEIVDVVIWSQVDDTGAPRVERHQVLSAEEVEPGHLIQYDLQELEFLVNERFIFISPDGIPDYENATEEQRNSFWFIAPDSGEFSDGTEAYEII